MAVDEALVLGGGGVTGIAWMTGLLARQTDPALQSAPRPNP